MSEAAGGESAPQRTKEQRPGNPWWGVLLGWPLLLLVLAVLLLAPIAVKLSISHGARPPPAPAGTP